MMQATPAALSVLNDKIPQGALFFSAGALWQEAAAPSGAPGVDEGSSLLTDDGDYDDDDARSQTSTTSASAPFANGAGAPSALVVYERSWARARWHTELPGRMAMAVGSASNPHQHVKVPLTPAAPDHHGSMF